MSAHRNPIPAQAGDAVPGGDCPGAFQDVSSLTCPAGSAPTARPAGSFQVVRTCTARFIAPRRCTACAGDFIPAATHARMCRSCAARSRAAGQQARREREGWH